jgi:hypothetical protein
MKQKLLLFALAATLPVLIPMFAQHVVNEPAIKKAIAAK